MPCVLDGREWEFRSRLGDEANLCSLYPAWNVIGLKMKEIMIIGSSAGIPAASIQAAEARGWRVHVASRRPSGGLDVGVASAQMFDSSVADGGMLNVPECLDGLVYCPGTIQLKPFHRLTEADFLADYRVNFLGAVRVIQQCLPALKKSHQASIVLFSSVAAGTGLGFHASIASAKAAVEGLARSLAAELAPKIRVNVIAPSLTKTPLASALTDTDAKVEVSAARHPLRAVGEAVDVAELVCFLLSDASRFMTGQTMRPDGGMSTLRLFS
jgi:3-oxoacyl-[acyl-carrier protein] reductase